MIHRIIHKLCRWLCGCACSCSKYCEIKWWKFNCKSFISYGQLFVVLFFTDTAESLGKGMMNRFLLSIFRVKIKRRVSEMTTVRNV